MSEYTTHEQSELKLQKEFNLRLSLVVNINLEHIKNAPDECISKNQFVGLDNLPLAEPEALIHFMDSEGLIEYESVPDTYYLTERGYNIVLGKPWESKFDESDIDDWDEPETEAADALVDYKLSDKPVQRYNRKRLFLFLFFSAAMVTYITRCS